MCVVSFTVNEKSVDKRVQGPDIRGPIGVAQASREGEQSRLKLIQLLPVSEGAECQPKYDREASTKLDAVEDLRSEDIASG